MTSLGEAKEAYKFLKAVNVAGASVTQDLSPEAGGLRQIMHDGFNTLIDPVKRSAVTGGYAHPRRPQPSGCEENYRFDDKVRHTVTRAADRIGGVQVDRITIEWPMPGHREEWWLAPALDCAMLKSESFRNGRLTR